MADRGEAYPDNAPGVFFVDRLCIDCDLCRKTAVTCFARNDQGGYSFVSKQPETPEEEVLCNQAIEECPVNAIGADAKA